jgi:hypothetical protein
MLVFSGFVRGTGALAGWRRSAALSLFLLAGGCVNLDSIFDCAALCDNRPHAHTRCSGAGCVVEGCDDGYADCNQNTKDGCEVNLLSTRKACGVCDNACAASDCLDGACWSVQSVITDTKLFARGLALDADSIYYSSNDLAAAGPSLRGTGSLYRLSLLGDVPGSPQVVSSGLDLMEAIVLDQDAAYGFTTAYDFQSTSSGASVARSETRVFRAPKQGGTVTFLGSTSLFASRPAVDATDVYWPAIIEPGLDAGLLTLDASADGQILGAIAGQHAYGIAHASKLGGPVTNIATPGVDAFDMMIRDGTLFAASNGVRTLALSSQTTNTLVSDNFTSRVLVDATHVYWTAIDDAPSAITVLKSMPLTGGVPTILWRDTTSLDLHVLTLQMVDDSENIYLAQSSGSVVRVPKVPSSATIIAGQQPCLSDVAVDDAYVYWSRCGGIRRVRISEFVQ